jgi:hypothetical protein
MPLPVVDWIGADLGKQSTNQRLASVIRRPHLAIAIRSGGIGF